MAEQTTQDGRLMDELAAVHRLLMPPPPGPDVVQAARARQRWAGAAPLRTAPPHTVPEQHAPVLHLNSAGHLPDARGMHYGAGQHRWGKWLVPVTAAAAVTAVIAGSLAVSGAIGRSSSLARPAAATALPAGVPRYFVALAGRGAADTGGSRATIGATATGAVLGSVTAPAPYGVFSWASGTRNDRVFVLAARRPGGGDLASHYRFYRLTLSRSGHPGALKLLPVPEVTGNIDGFAVSPDGSRLAISVAAVYRHYRLAEPSKVEMFSLATGAGRTWTWGNHGSAGWIEPFAQSLSWAADSRTLLFEGTASTAFTVVYLLDTAAADGSMPGAARQVHIAGHEPAEWSGNERGTGDRMLVTGNGLLVAAVGIRTAHGRPVSSQWARYEAEVTQLNKAIARAHGHPAAQARLRRRLQSTRTAYYEAGQEAETSVSMIAEFSLRTGKVVRVMSRNYVANGASGWTVQWVNTTGTLVIAALTSQPQNAPAVVGIQNGSTFAALPWQLQRTFQTEQIAW